MAARLGDIIYWAMCIVAAAFMAMAAYVLVTPGTQGSGIAAGYGVAAWLIGRAARYVLAGH